MATGLFSSRSKGLRNGLHEEAAHVEDQIAQIRDEIAELAKIIARDTAGNVSEARSKVGSAKAKAREAAHDLKDRAETDIQDLIAAGEDILAQFQDRYRDSGRKVRKTVHDHPLATLGIAAAAGFVIAALLRR
jgi:ElaB/YqjD/DUF883 family membrane-anchored ribosome-binding protein